MFLYSLIGIYSNIYFLSKVTFLLMCVVLEMKTQGSATEQYWIKEYQVSYGSDTQWFAPYMENGAKKVAFLAVLSP
jgi:hypothetical protein